MSGMPFVVAERGGTVLGFAKAGPYDDASSYYAEIAEATVYVERAERRAGTGRALLDALARRAQESGRIKLTAKIFTTNEASIGLFRSCGFREVGVHQRHGLLDGQWQDVLLVERRLGAGRLTGSGWRPRPRA